MDAQPRGASTVICSEYTHSGSSPATDDIRLLAPQALRCACTTGTVMMSQASWQMRLQPPNTNHNHWPRQPPTPAVCNRINHNHGPRPWWWLWQGQPNDEVVEPTTAVPMKHLRMTHKKQIVVDGGKPEGDEGRSSIMEQRPLFLSFHVIPWHKGNS